MQEVVTFSGKNTLMVKFVLKVAKSLHENGLPTHRLEEKLENLCESLNIKGEFFTTPGSIFASIEIDGFSQAHMVKVQFSDLNLEYIDTIEQIVNQIKKNELTILEALNQLEQIQNSPLRYSNGKMMFFFALSTGSAACIFGGQFPEIISSFLIGLGIGSFSSLIPKFPFLAKIFIIISAVYAVLVSALFHALFADFKQDVATICGLIILIPGFSFTISITEMVNNHLIAGLSRFTSAFITFTMLALGIGVGSRLMDFLPKISNTIPDFGFPFWMKWLALICVPLGFVVLFKAKPKDFIWIALACWCSYFSYDLSVTYLGKTFAVFVSAFLLGLLSNIFSNIKKRNSSIMLVPGMILLVPGSLGFFSISHLVHSNVIAGIETALIMLTTAMALVFGIIFSNIVYKSERY